MLLRLAVLSDAAICIMSKQPTVFPDRTITSNEHITSTEVDYANTHLPSPDSLLDTQLEKDLGPDGHEMNTQRAENLLKDVIPFKVKLCRKIIELQTCLRSSNLAPMATERLIQEGMLLYQNWESRYRSFFDNCVARHATLPLKSQLWYIPLALHWDLAVFLFCQCVERIDNELKSHSMHRNPRLKSGVVFEMKKRSSYATARLLGASCLGSTSDLHDTSGLGIFGYEAILLDPWSDAIVDASARAGENLLLWLTYWQKPEKFSGPEHDLVLRNTNKEELISHLKLVIGGLKLLGRKSDSGNLAAISLMSYFNSL